MSRPAVPSALKRHLYEEAGYRCAVPTCRGTSGLQMEHIEPWAKVKAHEFDNMIVLCAVCHSRITSREISKDAIRTYKRNLALINGRYSLFELRLIQHFFENEKLSNPQSNIQVAENDLLHLKGLIDDQLVNIQRGPGSVLIMGMSVSPVYVLLTDKGREFISAYFQGENLS
ncbi:MULTISPECIES: HNH endonuclease signature motif containing protein [Paracoccaceae]|jgi:hypothetical protein|uniref:HNH endonuclease signature motif containing protein n=1 Tax=Rhodobacterales TaxID=204455 RepID=UPI001D09DAC3|nr:HNH endonuclease signature motif containing protein [Boseongicola sp. H5]